MKWKKLFKAMTIALAITTGLALIVSGLVTFFTRFGLTGFGAILIFVVFFMLTCSFYDEGGEKDGDRT